MPEETIEKALGLLFALAVHQQTVIDVLFRALTRNQLVVKSDLDAAEGSPGMIMDLLLQTLGDSPQTSRLIHLVLESFTDFQAFERFSSLIRDIEDDDSLSGGK